jgi:hypothetical protein
MATKTFDCYEDPGHGWVKVPLKLLAELRIYHMISNYSYMRGEFAYLEEDNDAYLLVTRLKSQFCEVKFRGHHSDKQSKIRNYHSYDSTKIDWHSCKVH